MSGDRSADGSCRVFSAGSIQREGHWQCSIPTVQLLNQIADEILPALAFLAYVLVEAAVIYGLLKRAGAL